MNDQEGEYASVASLKKFLDAGFDSAFNFWLRDALVACLARGCSLDCVASVVAQTWRDLGEDRALLLCNLLDNHDTPRFTTEIRKRALATPEREMCRRYRTALALLFTLPGIPQIYVGDELGLLGGPDPENRRSMPPWAWTPADRKRYQSESESHDPQLCLSEPNTTFDWCRRLCVLRDYNAALHSGYYAELARPNGGQNVFAFFRGFGESRIVVVLNESDQELCQGSFPIQSNKDIRQKDKDALQDGDTLEGILNLNCAPQPLILRAGNLCVTMPPRSVGVDRLIARQ
jgi:hypothetical protein